MVDGYLQLAEWLLEENVEAAVWGLRVSGLGFGVPPDSLEPRTTGL